MTREEQQIHQAISKKFKTCLTLSIGLVVLLSIVRMIVYNQTSTFGNNLEKIQKEAYELQTGNLHLRTALAQKTGGLSQLSQQAQANGFVANPAIKYFNSPVSVAQKLP